ncbi:MAG TPA: hypothetical protein VFN51_01640 [Candidatus Saccharimonadales bacterium]|nr:hypothetical protein [Candidatus Saccharimonadales bacterium]
MKKILSSITATLAVAVFAIGQAAALTGSPYPSGQIGVDVSWPNCSAKISAGEPFGVVGVSYGLAYSAVNPCLAAEAHHFTNLSLYANTGLNVTNSTTDSPYWDTALLQCNGDTTCAAYHYGYNAGVQIANQSVAAGVSSNNWWLDVETGNTWQADTSLNDQSLQGEYDGLHKVLPNINIGAYSTDYQWGKIAGNWKPVDTTTNTPWAVWYATGVHRASQAAPYCAPSYSFTGGTIELVQFKGRIDQDYAC